LDRPLHYGIFEFERERRARSHVTENGQRPTKHECAILDIVSSAKRSDEPCGIQYGRNAAGLIFDTLIVRSFMTPSIAALLGRWFWWPVRVRQRPVPQKFGDENTRQLSLF